MKSLIYVAQELQAFFVNQKWRFCFIGGLALQRWGQPRLTQDVDVTLLTGFGAEKDYARKLLSRFSSRVPKPVDFALRNRVLLLKSDSGIGIDIALAGLPFETEVVKRSTLFEYLPDICLRTCSVEDLVVMKAFADRAQDWADVESIIIRQKGDLNYSYIRRRLKPLCELKETPEILARLNKLVKRRI
ncbi:MAG: nucleotidyl transferase AbiEii/AbiGii toxin family protein [Chlamydiota bacterium]|nr:nucleotidyl transferase AbiEii/AbiGii toxin family protein [Chlamydiota bacterium]